MKNLPPEMENLMWTLAESDNQQAITEFEMRFPDLKIELAKRSAMVRSLRSTRPGYVTQPSIPRFVPGPSATPEPTRGMYITAFVFATIALSVFAYTAVMTHHRRPVEAPTPVVVNTAPPAQSQSTPVVTSRTPTYPTTPQYVPQQFDQNPPPSLRDEPEILPPPADHSWQRPQSITMREVPLQTVLQAVADEGRLALDIAPGMPNPTVSVDYHDESAEDILKDLGRQYAFTPMLSDDGSALIIPVVRQSSPSDRFAEHGVGQ